MIQRKRCFSTAAAVLVALTMVSGFLATLPTGAAEPTPDAWIMGKVTDGSDPVPNSYVKVMYFAAEGIDIGYAFTDASGDYAVEVPAGFNYVVLVANGSYMMAMEPASVLPGQTKWVNFTLTPASEIADVTIKGKILDSLGDPVIGGHILGVVNGPAGTDSTPVYANITVADEIDGSYELMVIPGDYGGGVVAMDLPGTSMIDNTTDEYPLLSGETYWFNITVMPQSYEDDSAVYGYVTDKDTGDPLENVLVSVETWNEYMEDGRYTNYTYTDDQGYYEMDVVNGSANFMMMKGGYSIAMINQVDVPYGATIRKDAELVKTTCVVRGNVTDLSTDLPIPLARVFVTDGLSKASMAMTNSTGGYEMFCFDGDNLWIGAEAEQYSRDGSVITLTPGDEVWMDFGLIPVSSWIEGYVTDKMDGHAIQDAWVQARSPIYEDGTDTDEFGYYNISVAPGTFEVTVGAEDYIENYSEVEVLDGETKVHDVALYPWDLPRDCRLYGWVNDSVENMGISPARVVVRNDDASFRDEAWTDGDGFYEMYVPQILMKYGVNAWQHYPEYGSIDLTLTLERRMDVSLDPDTYRPNITYSQTPVDNITWINPTVMDIEVEDPNLREMMLMQLRDWKTEGSVEHYYVVDLKSTSFDPFSPSDTLPYMKPSVIDDNYTILEEWNGSATAGWLENTTDSLYLMAYEHSEGPLLYYGVGGIYNDPNWTDLQVTAIFDGMTGECLMFHPGWDDPIYPDEPFGTFEPMIMVVTFDLTDWTYMDRPDYIRLDPMNATQLTFTNDSTVPSGKYRTVFGAEDFGWQSNGFITNLTVDNDPPIADAGPDVNAVINTMTELDGSGSDDPWGDIVSYLWEFEDDGTPVPLVGEVVEYEFTALGSYAVNLTVTDGAGHEDTDMMWVVVGPDNPPTANAGPDFSVNEDATAQFSGLGSDDDVDIVNYTWTFTDQSLEVELWDETPTYVFSMPGTYDVTLVVTDTIDQTDSDTVTVTVNDITPPVAVAVADPEDSMLGESVTLDGSGSSDNSGMIVSYVWTFSDGGVAVSLSGESVDYTFSEAGEFVITLTVTDSGDNTDTDIITLTVTDDEDPVADAGPDQTGVVAGTEVTLDGSNSTDNSGTIESYIWTFTDENSIELSGETVTYVFDTVGTYTITLTVEDPSGNSDTDEIVVTVVAPNSAPVADAGPDQTASVGETVTLSAIGSTDSDGMIVSYTWTFMYDGELVTLTGMEAEFEFEIADTYEVTLTVTDDEGASDTDTVIIIVEGRMSQFLQDYWWLLAVVAAAVVFGVVFMLMRPGKGGKMPSEEVGDSEPEPEEEPPAPDELPPPPEDDL